MGAKSPGLTLGNANDGSRIIGQSDLGGDQLSRLCMGMVALDIARNCGHAVARARRPEVKVCNSEEKSPC